jgi:choline dehydrogenase-like flavoprotein
MILDLEVATIQVARPRVIVLGAGAVGIILSVALARKGISVLLCECGGRAVEPQAQALNRVVLKGRPHVGVAEGRARVLGGTTTLWGGQLLTFRDADFRARPQLGLRGWPITRTEIAPYYKAVAEMLALQSTTDDDTQVWQTLGMPRPDFGPNIELVLTRWLKEPSLVRMFRSDLHENPNLNVLLHATATGFVSSGEDGTIRAVEVRSASGKTLELEADDFVVATGTIEASRLMLAAAARSTLPWSTNPNVGANFQDHLDLCAGKVVPIDKKRFSEAFDNIFINGFKYNPKVILSDRFQASTGITNVAGNFTFSSSLAEHLSNLKIFLRAIRRGAMPPNLRSIPKNVLALASIWWPLVVRYVRDRRVFNPADLGVYLWVHCEQKPLASSRITLDPVARDVNGVPLAVLDWQVDGIEINAAHALCENLAAEFERRGLAKLIIDPRILSRNPSILSEARDTNHHCGGLCMAADKDHGVVDTDCRVYGTTNLYVAGAAVFPTSSFANPTFTAMALALRLGDHIGN